MLLGNLGAAMQQAPAARAVDQLPSLVARRILEGGATGTGADWLALLALALDFLHAPRDFGGIARLALQPGGKEDPVQRRVGMAVAHTKVIDRDMVQLALPVDSLSLYQDVSGLLAVSACVHAQGAAQRSRDAAEEFQARDTGQLRRLCNIEVQGSGTGFEDVVFLRGHARELPPQAQHNTRHAAVADQKVGADAKDRHRDVSGLCLQESHQVVLVHRLEENLGRAAYAEPGYAVQRRIRGHAAAHRWQAFDQGQVLALGGVHDAPPAACLGLRADSWSGNAWAQAVMFPAPRQTTRSPEAARSITMPGRSAGSSRGATCR